MYCVSLGNCRFEDCKRIAAEHPLLELRLDTLGFSLYEISAICSMPAKVIATCRASLIGSQKQVELLLHAIQAGAAYVDLEIETDEPQYSLIAAAAREKKAALIMSYHNFSETPKIDLLERVIHDCSKLGAAVVKIACLSQSDSDNVTLLSLLNKAENLVVIGMGPKGKLTRIVAPFLGSLWTYVAAEEGKETADGQLSVKDYREVCSIFSKISVCK